MPCLFAILALMTPRLVIILLWLFSGYFKGVYDMALWPVLGFIFLPTSLLWFTAVQKWYGGHWGFFQIIVLIIALSIDVSPASGRRKKS